ncbi:hypothetical protein [Pseudonocardia pini]|uniref:hypothetical protein n=1 Tax=Pseudonocardia pini TaxID=2758030 RepID=UPI0015EFDD89|nr:hypothetical protein [Pseudonocardia pini]
MPRGLLDLMHAQRGHFAFESGFHGDLRLDLDGFFAEPRVVAPFVEQLAELVRPLDPEVVCGPFTGGALVAYRIAELLGAGFLGSERVEPPTRDGLYPYRYRLGGPPTRAAERCMVVVDDVVNAGSAVGATLTALLDVGATPVGIATILTLGAPAADMAATLGVPLVATAREEISLWEPQDCALCAQGSPLT